jgi:FMN phosphatase YigB (HAD superfamily)
MGLMKNKMKGKKRLIFDLDDTLYKSAELRAEREKAILEFLGEKKKDYIELKNRGNGTIASLKELGISRERFYEIIEKVPIGLEEDRRLIDRIEKLSKRFELIILTNISTKIANKTLDSLGIRNFFSKVLGSDNFEHSKPHISCFRGIVRPGDICIGNNFEKDLEIPELFGAVTIIVGKKDNRADFFTSEIYDIESILRGKE